MTEIILAIDDVPAVMTQLPAELRNGNCGIIYEDGRLVVLDPNVAATVRKAADNLDKGRRQYLKGHASRVRKQRLADGIVNVNGDNYRTDNETRSHLVMTLMAAERNPSKKFFFESIDGPVELSALDLEKVLEAVTNFVEKCHAVEATLSKRIDQGGASSKDIEAAAWPRS